MLFFSMAISFIACGGGGENDENLPIDNGNTEKPKDDESQEPVLCSITPIGELNQGTPIINSHTDVTKRSSLMMNYRIFSIESRSSIVNFIFVRCETLPNKYKYDAEAFLW